MSSTYLHCHLKSCSSAEDIARLLTTNEYASMIEEYRSILDDDPGYLEFHHASGVLKVQFALKLHDLSTLEIGLCEGSGACGCCVLAALRSAIRLRAGCATRDGKAAVTATNGVSNALVVDAGQR